MNKTILIFSLLFAFSMPQITAQVCPHDFYSQCIDCCRMAESKDKESAESDFNRVNESCLIRATFDMRDIILRAFGDPYQMFNEVMSSGEYRQCIQEAAERKRERINEISNNFNDCRIDCCGLYPDC